MYDFTSGGHDDGSSDEEGYGRIPARGGAHCAEQRADDREQRRPYAPQGPKAMGTVIQLIVNKLQGIRGRKKAGGGLCRPPKPHAVGNSAVMDVAASAISHAPPP